MGLRALVVTGASMHGFNLRIECTGLYTLYAFEIVRGDLREISALYYDCMILLTDPVLTAYRLCAHRKL